MILRNQNYNEVTGIHPADGAHDLTTYPQR